MSVWRNAAITLHCVGMSEQREYAIAAYLALCRIFAYFSKVRISHILAFSAALHIFVVIFPISVFIQFPDLRIIFVVMADDDADDLRTSTPG